MARHQGRAPAKGAARLEADSGLDQTAPADGSTHWSSRRLAKKLGLTHMAGARVWGRYGLAPHLLRHHLVSDDENWLAKIQPHLITRGVFRSVPDLRAKLLRYIRHYNKTATPIKWTYSNPKHKIKP
ncbi:hypothetical protein BH18VER2_BH18VER2_01420 [soil metagenome]